MAKRKASGRQKPAPRTQRTSSTRQASRTPRRPSGRKRKASPDTAAARSTTKAPARPAKAAAARGRKKTTGKAGLKKAAPKKATLKKTAPRKATPKKAAPSSGSKRAPARQPAATRKARKTQARKRSRPAAAYEAPVPTPPSSLNMNRRGSAARTGRAELAEERAEHASLTPAIAGGDVDVNLENAYFSGDETPGGDNPTPDQDIVDDIGRALGVEYQDNEELRGSDKVADRDKHRWELDPASSEDYRDRR